MNTELIKWNCNTAYEKSTEILKNNVDENETAGINEKINDT